jgi:uracil-DNA glycosylase
MSIKFKSLNKTIIKCKKCPRLVKFIKKISTEKRKQNIKETYWGKPVTGFGDYQAKILILGLAPAAHGGNKNRKSFYG